MGLRLAVVVAALLAGPSATASDEPDVRVITSADRSGEVVDRKLLLSIYIGRIGNWPDGKPITVFTLPDAHPLHTQFCRQLLGTYPYVLRNAWDKLVYTGTGFTPTPVRSEEEMSRRIASTPNAIGYLPARPATGDASETAHQGVQP